MKKSERSQYPEDDFLPGMKNRDGFFGKKRKTPILPLTKLLDMCIIFYARKKDG